MISLIVPSRYRDGLLARMWDSALATADEPEDVELVARLDQDDPTVYGPLPGRVTMVRRRRMVMSQLWNDAQARAAGDVFWHGGDDNIFRTPGWDTMVLEAIARWPDGIVFVHGRDGAQDAGLGTHGFVTAAWVRVSGWMVPPYFPSDFNDTWLTEVADRVGRRVYLPGMLIEHMHHVWGKGVRDRTHLEREARHDASLWDKYAPERAAHVRALRAAMVETPRQEKGPG